MSLSRAPIESRFVLCLVPRESLRLASHRLVRVLIAPEEDADTSSPSFSLGRLSLPWAPTTLRESTAVEPEGADRARGSACAKGADASTSRGLGTSATARSRNASGRSAAGRRRGGRPSIARTPRPKPATPRPNARAASGPRPRPRLVQRPEVTPPRGHAAQPFFLRPLCDRPGCHEHPVSSPRNPARYCGPACRQAVRNVQDRERKWLSRGTLDGRKKRAFEYQAARRRRASRPHKTAAPTPSGHLRSDDSSGTRRSSIIV